MVPNASGVDELGARVNIANSHNSDAFVSVHINSFNNPSVGGIATYYYSKTGNDARLAQKVQNQIANVPGFNGDRGIQEGNLYVLRHTNMPAILVELGFISNPNEERALKSDQTKQDFANRIALLVLLVTLEAKDEYSKSNNSDCLYRHPSFYSGL